MADVASYLEVEFPYDTRTVSGDTVRLYGHDGERVIGGLMDANGRILGALCWYGDGYIWPVQPLGADRVPARQTSGDDLIPPPAARAALIAAQEAIVAAVSARIAAAGDVPPELLDSDRAVLAAAQAQIAALNPISERGA